MKGFAPGLLHRGMVAEHETAVALSGEHIALASCLKKVELFSRQQDESCSCRSNLCLVDPSQLGFRNTSRSLGVFYGCVLGQLVHEGEVLADI
jgi:hypothetical protein